MRVMEPGSEILKVDEAGRVRTPPEAFDELGAEAPQGSACIEGRYSCRLTDQNTNNGVT
jgi:hypothetical protein